MKFSNHHNFFFWGVLALFAGHLLVSLFFSSGGFLTEGRSLLLAAGLCYGWTHQAANRYKLSCRRFLTAAIPVVAALAVYYAPLAIWAFVGEVTFTYGSNGLDTTFRSRLPWYALYYGITVLFGTEVVFRLWGISGAHVGDRPSSLRVILSAVYYTVWAVPGMYAYIQFAELDRVGFLILDLFLNACIAGFWYTLFGNLLISGLWTILTGFWGSYILNDIDLGLNSAYYLVSSTSSYDWASITAHSVITFLLILWYNRRNQSGQSNDR